MGRGSSHCATLHESQSAEKEYFSTQDFKVFVSFTIYSYNISEDLSVLLKEEATHQLCVETLLSY